jgi:hypothetical protein
VTETPTGAEDAAPDAGDQPRAPGEEIDTGLGHDWLHAIDREARNLETTDKGDGTAAMTEAQGTAPNADTTQLDTVAAHPLADTGVYPGQGTTAALDLPHDTGTYLATRLHSSAKKY